MTEPGWPGAASGKGMTHLYTFSGVIEDESSGTLESEGLP